MRARAARPARQAHDFARARAREPRPKICNAIREIDRHGIGRPRRTGSAGGPRPAVFAKISSRDAPGTDLALAMNERIYQQGGLDVQATDGHLCGARGRCLARGDAGFCGGDDHDSGFYLGAALGDFSADYHKPSDVTDQHLHLQPQRHGTDFRRLAVQPVSFGSARLVGLRPLDGLGEPARSNDEERRIGARCRRHAAGRTG